MKKLKKGIGLNFLMNLYFKPIETKAINSKKEWNPKCVCLKNRIKKVYPLSNELRSTSEKVLISFQFTK